MSMDNTKDEEQVVTKSPIETDSLSPSAALHIVATRAPVKIEESPL